MAATKVVDEYAVAVAIPRQITTEPEELADADNTLVAIGLYTEDAQALLQTRLQEEYAANLPMAGTEADAEAVLPFEAWVQENYIITIQFSEIAGK